MSFHFEVGEIKFRPQVVIKNVSQRDVDRVGDGALQNLMFHLGLAEMPSYWKATASPRIIVEAGYLNKAQLNWWHDLFLKGMGQYFYENKINFRAKNFLTITSRAEGCFPMLSKPLRNNILLPIGGGKDAIVTYEILKKAGEKVQPFVLNPKKEHSAILRVAGEKNPIVVERTIDPALLKLNQKGYLNGHTPFSSYLAFLTVLCAALFNQKYVVLSNERSSNEGNVQYLGHEINHQYSKSWDFEKRFRSYSKAYLAPSVEYFSFLRPLYELQIAKIFSRYPKYFPYFLSCNEAHKTLSGAHKPTERWCGKCSKCLFVFLALCSFAGEERTVCIFKKNLLRDASLKPLLDELTGKRKFKPFECVGTIGESRTALSLCQGKIKTHRLLCSWNPQHALPPHLENKLKSVVG
ncbi:MAG: hypothetical protein UY53_C0002G0006 [Parcubacteria group bacterium GW2011_GWA2_50_10]|nr:MAG: hypothetical protein UY25_C0002G0064 [Candidatus Yanofskybacteria bacterium GW2011_GWC1_48_11]KKW04688.1 MAG: hypothetical protein UY38_C0001G0255 [Parcubacteria group bacterium GW2011_GWB1_49_12]KKW09012.1 MAG: hypothetical protein UY45_C0002G0064 [Parcubacteria group bacterium GW2011_GWA1_49_26]KKW14217.1 MAG: hypothetical protein UY53_C0002G0006 [Parcubacteria group bacterium GW2011_GWA2_50_10]